MNTLFDFVFLCLTGTIISLWIGGFLWAESIIFNDNNDIEDKK